VHRRGVAVCLALIITVFVGIGPAASARTPEPLSIRITKGQIRLEAGVVVVPFNARCRPPLQSFELDVSVLQGATFGSTVILQAGVVPCDGRWHRMISRVSAQVGGTSFLSGSAVVDAFLGANDPNQGGDQEATDSVNVTL
jgi:hypothetical protein